MLSFGFVWFILNVIVFVYNGLKESLILQTKPRSFLHISFFHRNLICIYFKKAYCAAYGETWIWVCSYICLHLLFCFVLTCIRPGTRPLSHKGKKPTKFVYFFETTMYECSIFWINIMVCINLVVNSMLFWIEVKPGRLF